MKHQSIIVCIAILIMNFAGCAETKAPVVNNVANTKDIKVTAETTPAPTRAPLPPNVREDADGNLKKPDGWRIQEIIPKETQRRTNTGKTRKGRTVIYNVLSITPQGRPVSEAVSPVESYNEWRIYFVRELSGRDGKIFCYEYGASLFGRSGNGNTGLTTSTSYRLCDYDGDGKYELNSQKATFAIPEWVKTLPGNPAAVNSNANY